MANTTIVTMLVDIGRESWTKYPRSYSEYLANLSHLLGLDNNIVIFIEDAGIPFVEEKRKPFKDKTVICRITKETLPVYKYLPRFTEIIHSESFKKGQYNSDCPEMNNELYHLAVHNKVYLVDQVAKANPFNSNYFIWFDCGLGHSKVIYPKVFNPKGLIENHFNEIAVIQLQSINPHYADMSFFFKSHLDVIGGGFFGGSKEAISRYALEYDRILNKAMDSGLIDDDQSITLFVYFDNPDLFFLQRGTWYSALDFDCK